MAQSKEDKQLQKEREQYVLKHAATNLDIVIDQVNSMDSKDYTDLQNKLQAAKQAFIESQA